MGTYLDLLPKALIAARANGADDTDWLDGRAIANWRNGWKQLEESGLVEIYREKRSARVEDDTDLIVRLTKEGVKFALRSIQSDKALEHQAKMERVEASHQYIQHPQYGII